MNLTPPGQTTDIHARSALVLAPHSDDETLGCGGLVHRLTEAGATVHVLFMSDGGGRGPRDAARAEAVRRRRAEAREACEVLGVADPTSLDLPDGHLSDHVDAMADGVLDALLGQCPELLLVPSPLEGSADHRATFAAVHRLLGPLRRDDALWEVAGSLDILAYEINHPQYPDVLVDVGDRVEVLERAMACYASQQERHDYLGARLGLLRFRAMTLPAPEAETPGATHVEAYRRLTLADFTTRDPAALVTHLGGAAESLTLTEGPTISVIVRTKDRPELLAEALESLEASTWRKTEIVLVNDGGTPPEVSADISLPLVRVDLEQNRGRAGAANAGIAAASGEYIAFLDDDDLVMPSHFETLAGLVGAAGVRVAYTDAAVGVYELGAGGTGSGDTGTGGWQCTERRLPYSRDFDPDLLLLDNYIPFNTVLIERSLIDSLTAEAGSGSDGPLDESLPFFEDWDFLIRLAQKTPFHHLARVTCEYRQFRGGGHHILGDGQRSDFLAMKAKVIERHRRADADLVARVVDRLRGETVVEQETVDRLMQDLERSEGRYHELNGRLDAMATHTKVLEGRELHAQEKVKELEGLERQLSTDLQKAYDEIERLNGLIETMEGTRAWRLHQWVQGLKSGGGGR